MGKGVSTTINQIKTGPAPSKRPVVLTRPGSSPRTKQSRASFQDLQNPDPNRGNLSDEAQCCRFY
ncbi:hypothetical protein TorRG33x02_082370 [Trema orientale]|uniref:Uncharacterized protein n=1 Tax=Trema orientale TaxID=63057 RepID=A0A2P5FDX0_TREOI|nr:hypothetical protein TorRG33x02_082370 [Trema orientale]